MSGWYPDPTGRFEYRYHNDAHWTADVASNGQRFVDPLPSPGANPTGPAPQATGGDGGNGIAIASMVCGIVATAIAWAPFVGLVGLVSAIVGLALSVPAMRRSKRDGVRRGAAIAGLVTSAVGLVLGALGIVFTVVLVQAIGRFDDPGPHAVEITSCTAERGDIVATGQITNQSDRQRDYSVRIDLGSEDEWVGVADVPAGETEEFTVRRSTPFGDQACEIGEVRGPVPFGLDPAVFDE